MSVGVHALACMRVENPQHISDTLKRELQQEDHV